MSGRPADHIGRPQPSDDVGGGTHEDGPGDDGGSLGVAVAEGVEFGGEAGVVATELGLALGVDTAVGGAAPAWAPEWDATGRLIRLACGLTRLTSLSGSAETAAPATGGVAACVATWTAEGDVPAWVPPAGPLMYWITTGP